MDYGVVSFVTDYSISPAELARVAEDLGFESMFVTEHTHIPASRESPWPGGAELPREYSHTLDPFVALATAAAVTTTLRIGTGVCLVAQHDPIVLAKQVASLDHLSGGRVLLGVGAGWNREEMLNHGVDPSTRFGRMREHVEAMRAIWTQDEASYAGRHVSFERIWSWPKPARPGGPPVLVGGSGPKVFDRVLAYGDGWTPIGRQTGDLSEIGDRIAELQERAAAAGRDRIPVTVYGGSTNPDTLGRFSAIGVDRVLHLLPSAGADDVVPLLQQIAAAHDAAAG
ncbi:MAG: LLM class F420-dependent oxidoreductase [Geodermatophilaceae bacterium]|nr:LLM class F420-dependent oxidoreductase [Geodermatophilaceae bacterium]MDQ3456995.1 LLM class F420-dependent oxidoreductase [Actinomycetota bacterium]